MCEPTTAAIALMAGAGLVSAYGQHQAGRYTQAVASENARVAELAARDAERRGHLDEMRHRRRVRHLIGRQQAQLAASGVDVGSGSAASLITGTAGEAELDALTLRYNAQLEAWGMRAQATDIRAQGRLAKLRGNYGAAESLLTAGSQAFGFWAQRRR